MRLITLPVCAAMAALLIQGADAQPRSRDAVVGSASAPAGTPTISLDLVTSTIVLGWEPMPDATAYDVVRGDLGTLRDTGGDFTVAIQNCLAINRSESTLVLQDIPDPGAAFFYLVRGTNSGGAGTYDSGDPGQVGERDAEIDASPRACGTSACGDGVCNAPESCNDCPADCGVCACSTDADCQPASCCNPTSCITIREPQSCNGSTCGDGCWICLSSCQCQNGACIALF